MTRPCPCRLSPRLSERRACAWFAKLIIKFGSRDLTQSGRQAGGDRSRSAAQSYRQTCRHALGVAQRKPPRTPAETPDEARASEAAVGAGKAFLRKTLQMR